jgi:hypothetical protein
MRMTQKRGTRVPCGATGLRIERVAAARCAAVTPPSGERGSSFGQRSTQSTGGYRWLCSFVRSVHPCIGQWRSHWGATISGTPRCCSDRIVPCPGLLLEGNHLCPPELGKTATTTTSRERERDRIDRTVEKVESSQGCMRLPAGFRAIF